MTIYWLRLKNSFKNCFWWIHLRRGPKLINFTDEELDDMWEDDTIDIKNFTHMDPGPARDEMRLMLTDRRNWYIQQRLDDWADQINIALWIEEGERRGRAET